MDCPREGWQDWVKLSILYRGKLAKVYRRSRWKMEMPCCAFNLVPDIVWGEAVLELLKVYIQAKLGDQERFCFVER